jgi:hypothetical protein
MLIKLVYEVDPLKCPKCGEEMYVVSFIERHQMDAIEKILKHGDLWKDKVPRRPPPEEDLRAAATTEKPYYGYTFLEPA